MSARVAILDLTSGEASERPGDTLTLDVPVDPLNPPASLSASWA